MIKASLTEKVLVTLTAIVVVFCCYEYYSYLMNNPNAMENHVAGVEKVELDGHTYYKSISNGTLTHSEACQCKTR